MQILIDDSDFTSAGKLRWIAAILTVAANTVDNNTPDINGTSEPVVLVPIERSIDAQPLAAAPTDPAQMDPAAVFARASVPTGTTPDPTLPALAGNASLGGAAASPPAVAAFAPPAPPAVAMAPAAPAAPIVGVPAAANPSAPVTAAAGTASDRDKAGIPWDARIHSETRKTNADGTWRFRRNLDAAVKAAVMAELVAVHGIQTQLAGVPSAPPAPPADTSVGLQPGLGFHQAAAPVPVSTVVPMGVSNAPHAPVVPASNFRELMTKVNQALAHGRLTQVQLTQACKACNLDSITALAAQPAMVAIVDAQINEILGAVAA